MTLYKFMSVQNRPPKPLTQRQQYLAAGFKLMPSGRINSFQWMKHLGRLGSRKDPTWKRDKKNPNKGHHACCGSKRDYYHKIGCSAAGDGPDDLSDLKDL